MEIQVPVGKKIRFDESLIDSYNPWVVRRASRENRYWNHRYGYKIDWDDDDYFDWHADVDYVMTEEGRLEDPVKQQKDAEKKLEKKTKTNADSLRRAIEDRERQNERDRQKLEQQDESNNNSTGKTKTKNSDLASLNFFTALII